MDSKITLVKTSHDDQKREKTENRSSNKSFKARGGKHQGFHSRKYPPRNYDNQKGENIPEQRQEQETEAVRSQPQEQTYDSYYDQNQAYQENGYNGRNQSAEYGSEQEYRFACDFPRAKDYSDIATIAQTFPHLKDVNGSTLDIDGLTDLRCFIMRSNNEDDIHKAVKYGIWTSTPKSNEFLNNMYEECLAKKVPIFLFYSVVRSGQFVAVAQMTSKIIEKSFQYWWEGDKWVNHFQVKWHFIKDVPYKYFSHLYMDDDLPVTRARDCTGVPLEVTKEMLRIYRDYNPYNSIFNAFPYMDVREDMLRSYKNSVQMYQRYYTAGESYNAGYAAQGSNTSSYQAPQYFKYNSFPAKKEGGNSVNAQSKSFSPKKDNSLDNLYKEFEITFTFYNDEIKKWEKDGEALNTLVSGDKKEELTSKYENLKSREKEILEGLEVLENKYKAVIQGSQEFEQKVNDQEAQRKQQIRVKDITSLLEKFKEGFNTSKKNMSSLYEKIEALRK